jgi:hypothetical protein
MNALSITALILLLISIGSSRAADPLPPRSGAGQSEVGVLNGAPFGIRIPTNWNGGLVMFCRPFRPNSVPPEIVPLDPMVLPYLESGFAVARSAFSEVGWALAEGLHDTEALRQWRLKGIRPSSGLAPARSE